MSAEVATAGDDCEGAALDVVGTEELEEEVEVGGREDDKAADVSGVKEGKRRVLPGLLKRIPFIKKHDKRKSNENTRWEVSFKKFSKLPKVCVRHVFQYLYTEKTTEGTYDDGKRSTRRGGAGRRYHGRKGPYAVSCSKNLLVAIQLWHQMEDDFKLQFNTN